MVHRYWNVNCGSKAQQGCAAAVIYIFTVVPTVPTVLPKITSNGCINEALDIIDSIIDKRFNQESFGSYAQVETLLVKAANGLKHRTAKMLILERYPGSLVFCKLC